MKTWRIYVKALICFDEVAAISMLHALRPNIDRFFVRLKNWRFSLATMQLLVPQVLKLSSGRGKCLMRRLITIVV